MLFTGGSWRYRFKASSSAAGRAAATSQVVLSGHGDPGYYFTSVGLAETALCLAGKTAGCLRTGVNATGGVGTVSMAIEPAVLGRRLQAIGAMQQS